MPGPILDLGRDDDRHTAERLSGEPIIWLGSTRPDGRPHQVPVWFVWDDPVVLLFSMAGTVKLNNLRYSPLVALALDTSEGGQDVVIADGTAEVAADDHQLVQSLMPRFADKYSSRLPARTLAEWRRQFSVPVLIRLSRVVAWSRRGGELLYRSVP